MQASTSEPIYTGDNPTEKFSLMSYNVLADELVSYQQPQALLSFKSLSSICSKLLDESKFIAICSIKSYAKLEAQS